MNRAGCHPNPRADALRRAAGAAAWLALALALDALAAWGELSAVEAALDMQAAGRRGVALPDAGELVTRERADRVLDLALAVAGGVAARAALHLAALALGEPWADGSAAPPWAAA